MELRSDRLRFREMVDRDLDAMAELLGDPDVMGFYPRPKTREEAQGWIEWNQANSEISVSDCGSLKRSKVSSLATAG